MAQLLSESAKGVYVIAATPFKDDGRLDLESCDSLAEFYLDCGVHGMTILGMMGEAPKLAADESLSFMRRMLQRIDGRVPVVVGVSSPGTDNLVALSREAMDLGAAGVMIAPQPGLKTEVQILGYFEEVFTRLGPDVPVCYQDYPQSTGVSISVPTFNQLVTRHPQLVMLKHEDFPGLRKISQVRESAEHVGARRVSILVGNGGLYYPLELRRGADGAMTGFAYPEMLVQVYELFAAGRADEAESLFDAYLPLVRYEFQVGIGLAIRKEILRRRGAIKSASVRAPGPRLDAADQAELDHLIERLPSQATAARLAGT